MGNVFYELLTGRLPFEGDISQVYSSILKNEPVHTVDINPNAKPVDEVIMKCLNKSKDKRYSNMGELLEELKKYRSRDDTGEDTVIFDD